MWYKVLLWLCGASVASTAVMEGTAFLKDGLTAVAADSRTMMDMTANSKGDTDDLTEEAVDSRSLDNMASDRLQKQAQSVQVMNRQSREEDCEWTIEGITWECNNNCTVMPGVIDAEQCAENCLAESWCVGFTWELNDVSGTLCYLFGELSNQQPCSDCSKCTSGMVNPISGVCPLHDEVILEVESASSELECLELCANYPGCNFYTWGNGSLSNQTCFLLKECEAVDTCESEYFHSGAVECFNNLPGQCKKYMKLFEEDRNVATSGNPPLFCDKTTAGSQLSPNWLGEGWYRMFPPAGTMIPEVAPGSQHCGTHAAGYLVDPHPSFPGENVVGKVCYEFGSNSCLWPNNINITNCGDYFVYYLVNTQYCRLRYCAT